MIGYFILGLRRSGNHMFINLIIDNYEKVLYYNDIKIDTKTLQNHHVPKHSSDIGNNNLASKLVNHFKHNPKCIIFSFEDMSVDNFNIIKDSIKKIFHFRQILEFVVIRDLLNCMSSRLEANNTNLVPVDHDIINLWHEHFYSDYFKLNYNFYLTDFCNYKELIKEKLQLKKADEVLSVPQFFSGSSFARSSLERQDTNDYLNRYKKYKEHTIIADLLKEDLSYIELEFNIMY